MKKRIFISVTSDHSITDAQKEFKWAMVDYFTCQETMFYSKLVFSRMQNVKKEC